MEVLRADPQDPRGLPIALVFISKPGIHANHLADPPAATQTTFAPFAQDRAAT